jgi:protein TonB
VQSGSGIKDEEANAEGNYKYTTSGDDLSKKRADSKSEKDKEQYYFSTDATTTPPSTAAENKSNTVYSKNKNTEDKKAEAPQKSLEETAVQKNDKNYTRTNNTEKEIGGKKEEKKSTKKIKNKPSAAAGNGSVANEQQQPKETTTETVYDLDGLTANDSVSTSIVYENPEIPALFPGGNDSLSKYIFKNFKLPSDYRSENLSGTKIYVQFIIDTEGKVQKAKIVKGINPAYDTEALRIINAMPKWKPAKQNGKTVNSKITLPIQLEIK